MIKAIAIVFLLLPVPAAPDAEAGKWQELRESLRATKTISARFEQHKNLKILARPLVSKGRFHFRAPGSIRWEYLSPIKAISLVHRGNTQRFSWVAEQGFVKDSSAEVEAMRVVMDKIVGWMSGRFDQDPTFLATLEPGPPLRVILVPQEPAIAELIARVELRFSARLNVVAEVLIVENEQSSTLIRFDQVKLNQLLPDRLFEEVD